MLNYKVSLFKLNVINVNVCKREFASTKTQYLTSRVISFISSKIRGGVQNTGALSQVVLFIITFREWSRGKRKNRGVWSPCVPQKKTIRYNRSLDGGTRRRTTEDSMSSAPHDWHGRTALNRARREKGGVANLNFPSRQPPRDRFSAFAGINGHVTAGLLSIRAR